MSETNEVMLKQVLRKRAASIPLDNAEQAFADQYFNDLITAKKSVAKTVRIITGDDVRKSKAGDISKSKVDAESAREYKEVNQAGKKIQDDDPKAKPKKAEEKMPDADEKPKAFTTENQRLSDAIQDNVDEKSPITSEPAAKFVSLDPALPGDIVVKNFSRSGMQVFKGVVIKINSEGQAVVKWANGLTTFEWANALVKAKVQKDHLEGSDHPADPNKGKNIEVPAKKSEESGDIKKDGDIASAKAGYSDLQAAPVGPMENKTPFESVVCILECVVDLAGKVKSCQNQHVYDEEVTEYLDGVLKSLREIAEGLLSALSMELTEAQETEEE